MMTSAGAFSSPLTGRPSCFVPSRGISTFKGSQQTRQLHIAGRPSARRTYLSSLPPGSINAATLEKATATTTTDVLGTQDIVVGTILAFLLAFGYSFLNGQSSSSNFISWRSQVMDDVEVSSTPDSANEILTKSDDKVFDEESWREISRPENYVLYTSRIRDDQGKDSASDDSPNVTTKDRENKLVVVALLVLFVPIFSVEFFFALSRQFMCGGDPFTQAGWAQQLCSPYLGH